MSPIDFEEDAQVDETTGPGDAQLRKVAQLADWQKDLERRIEEKEGELKELKAQWRKVAESELPEYLQNEVGMLSFKLLDGREVSVKESLKCSVPKKNMDQVVDWLESVNAQSLVKRDFRMPFDKGDDDKLERLKELLDAHGFNQYAVDSSVHTGQLKKLIEELEQEGEEVPLQLLGAYHHRQTVIK